MPRWMLVLTVVAFAACNGGDDGTDDEDSEDSESDASPEVQAILDLTGDATNGADLYGANCESCHAADGSGGIGPSLVDELQNTDEYNEFLQIILDGEGVMPGFSGSLSDQDIADIWAYALDSFGP